MTLREQLEGIFLAYDKNFFHQKNFNASAFEDTYIALREKENRIYPDEVVRQLPEFFSNNSLRKEWTIRKQTLTKLLRYLRNHEQHKTILEIGCGNGWLSHHLATLPHRQVVGVDINKTELKQAARVFNDFGNLSFLHADIFNSSIPVRTFDIIIMASSIQYFKEIKTLINTLLNLLTENGEIHIIDSPVYRASEIQLARERSAKHFAEYHSPMAQFYYYHSWESFKDFNVKILFRPRKLLRWITPLKSYSPFPWIRITK